jgi:hypothetical protein
MAGPADRPATARMLEAVDAKRLAYMPAAQAGGKEAVKAVATEEAGASSSQTELVEPHRRAEHPRPEAARWALEPGQAGDRSMELG